MKASILKLLRNALPPLVVAILVVAVWDGLVRWNEWQPFYLPAPLRVAQAVVENFKSLASATGVTALAALCGFAGSLIAGTLIAFTFSQSKMIRVSCYPYAIFLQTVPIVAIAPLIISWFDYGFQSVCIVAFIISLFPVITNATAGMLAVDPDLLDLFRLHNASRWQVWIGLRLPASVPHIVTGARISSGLAVIGAIVGEFFAGHSGDWYGLGNVITVAISQLKTPYLLAAVIASTLLGLVIFATMSFLSSTILARWYDHE